MGLIAIEGMEFFAYHGCFEEEQIIGGRFITDISFEAGTRGAEEQDTLTGTVNYQKVYEIIAREMTVKSKLIEHLAARIITAVYAAFPGIWNVTVKVSKMNPPIGGKVDKVSITLNK
ncbi:MAG: dihydroneopterin aldolase [Bacteroidota bacterium]